jgi:hypothetical protein
MDGWKGWRPLDRPRILYILISAGIIRYTLIPLHTHFISFKLYIWCHIYHILKCYDTITHVVSKFWRTLLDTSLGLVSQSGDTRPPTLIFSLVSVLHGQLVVAVVGSLWHNGHFFPPCNRKQRKGDFLDEQILKYKHQQWGVLSL